MGAKVPSGQWLSQCPFSPAFLRVGTPQYGLFFPFQFDVIDNIMCLDDVLGFINPETQIPNTVLLARAGWVCQREGQGPAAAVSLERTRISPTEMRVTSIKSCDEGPGSGRTVNPEGAPQPARMVGLVGGEGLGRASWVGGGSGGTGTEGAVWPQEGLELMSFL